VHPVVACHGHVRFATGERSKGFRVPTELICARCNKANPPEARFCLACGNSLADASHPAREERKVVSVLFADLVGFTSQAEQLDPEEVRAVLQPYHAAVRSDIERFGGTVEKFIGDAVMAIFGAPVAHEDDPERAVRAALAMRDRIKADEQLHLRIGITTGEALVALDARPQSGEGMAAGDVVNTAARLQTAAPVDGILVDETTFRATSRAIEYREHPAVSVKGKVEPITVWEAQTARSRFGVDVRHVGRAPLVGRVRELELLAHARERAHTEQQPQLVTLVGVPGIGKSRIVWELFQQIDVGSELVAWRQGRSLPYSESISFWALGEIVKAEAGILETDDPQEAAVKLDRALDAVELEASDAEWVARHLRPLVGLEAGVELRGDHRGEAFAAWRRFFEALADRRPLVLIFEDLHWADDGLLDFVDYLVEWATGVPLLIVGTARPELLARRSGWGGGKPNTLTVSLSPLSEAETGRLVAELVERAVMADTFRETVVARAEGNPLYAEEFARLVAEGGRADKLPESVQGIIAARLDALPREEKELVQHAAVVGKVFWSGALVTMSGESRDGVETRLHALERKEFVRRERRASVAGETEYAFRHILVRDVAYGQIPRAERGERHARAAAWIESLGRPADHAELLAQHYLAAIELARAAGRPDEKYADQALPALRVAGDRAMALNAFGSAARYLRAALDLMASDDPERPQLLFRYGKALRISEEGGAEVLSEAEERLREIGDLETAAEAAVLQAELAWFGGDGEITSAHLARAAELVDGLPPSYSKAYVLSDLARYHMLATRSEEAIALGGEALRIAEALGLDEIRAHALINVGTARGDTGDPAGVAELERALYLALEIKSPEAARAMNNLGAAVWSLGDIKRADELRRQALTCAREFGNVSVEKFQRSIVPGLDYSVGNWDVALAAFDDFIAEAEAGGGHAAEGSTRAARAGIRFARGDTEGALRDAELGVVAGRRAGDPQAVIPPLAFMTWLMVRLGRIEEAHACLDDIMAQRAVGSYLDEHLALAAVTLDRQEDMRQLIGETTSPHLKGLLTLIIDGRLEDAAARLESVERRAAAAMIRLHHAELSLEAGDELAARSQLEQAVAFWRSVGATHLITQADELLTAIRSGPRTTADSA
jgi:class 3 adenylate cyclase/tetratricopeptide (TPR) repeat protein